MEKLNFGAIKNTLSRSEMKKIMAGSGSGGSAGVRCTPTSQIVCIDDCKRSTVEDECGSADEATCYPNNCV